MSIQAVSWVLSQSADDLPGTARLVMIALANHADHTDGHCWPSIETIAKEAGIGERTVSRYLGALSRNGFIDKRQTQKNGHFRSNDYWILFERVPAQWQFFDRESDPDAKMADGETLPDEDSRTPTLADGRTPLVADANKDLTVRSEPSDSEILAKGTELPESPPAAPPAPPREPQGFAPSHRQRAQARLQAAEEARKPLVCPVIRGSEPWKAWVKHGHRDSLYGTVEVNGRRDIGWYFPSLWPPKTGDPPPTPIWRNAASLATHPCFPLQPERPTMDAAAIAATRPDFIYHIALTQPGMDKQAEDALRLRKYPVYRPLIHAWVPKRGGGRRQRTRSMFPGYLFVLPGRAGWEALRESPGIRDLLRINDHYATLSYDDPAFRRILEKEEELKKMPAKASKFSIGQRVRAVKGPFVELIGHIEALDSNGRADVLIDLLKRKVRLTTSEEFLNPA